MQERAQARAQRWVNFFPVSDTNSESKRGIDNKARTYESQKLILSSYFKHVRGKETGETQGGQKSFCNHVFSRPALGNCLPLTRHLEPAEGQLGISALDC